MMKLKCAFITLLAVNVVATILFAGCDSTTFEENSTASNLPTLPKLGKVDDVCTKMTDDNFKDYCYAHFDKNNDGKVSMSEAAEVSSISCSTAADFTGIEYFSGLKSITSTSVEIIDLRYNTELTTIQLNSSNIKQIDLSYNQKMTRLTAGAFTCCENLTSVILPSCLKMIGDEAFMFCTYLISVFPLPEGLWSIGESAFNRCTSLTSITLPSTLIVINSDAFLRCSSLNTVLTHIISPPSKCPFSNIDTSAILYAPPESIEAYKDSDWADYFTEILPL